MRDEMTARGHYAMSCDLLPSRTPGPHYQGSIFDVLDDDWDMGIFFPPCTRLTVAGARWFKGREAEQAEAIEFVERLWDSNIPRVAIENPIGVLSTRSKLGKPTQIIQPWMFGHPETKATCLWLKGLPPLVPTNNVKAHMLTLPTNQRHRIHMMPPGPDRARERSKTFPGIAAAMGSQWGTT